MKKLYGSFAAKLLAVILLCAAALVFVTSLAGAASVQSREGYTGGYQRMEENYIDNLGEQMLTRVGGAYTDGSLSETHPEYLFYGDENAFWFEILGEENQVLLSNYEGGKTLWEGKQTFTPWYSLTMQTEGAAWAEEPAEQNETRPEVTPTPRPVEEEITVWELRDYRDQTVHRFHTQEEVDAWVRENTVTVRGYLPDPLPACYPETREMWMLGFLYSWRYALLWALGLSLLLGVLLFIFLIRAAGHRKGTDRIVESFVEKIPFDLFTAACAAGCFICLLPLFGGWKNVEFLVVLLFVTLGAGLLFLLWCMSLAVRVKNHSLLKNCLIWRICSWLWKSLGTLFRNLPLLWKWAVGMAVLAFLDLILRMNSIWYEGRTAAVWFFSWLVLGGATFYAVLAFRRLRRGAQEIAAGNLLATVDEKHLLGDLKEHARDLNHIRDGLNGAVEQRMKSERFRTELITNVSHDIKTPLTSIVNYVDLLQKEEPQTEKQKEYLEVLSRQSGKLKKLIEDLIEASKASTGNLSVDLQPCDLAVLLDQSAGEYAERLEKAGLELVLQKPEHPVMIRADGRHLWRVFDNLLNNIVKYAMPGTRVYLNLRERDGQAEVSFRNISREALNLDARELTERFVRGDASRHTEGNGLGLSIAMSLTRLQKGDMDIDVDGDLFKVILRFPM